MCQRTVMNLGIWTSPPCFAFVAPVNSPEATSETTNDMDVWCPERAENKAPSRGGQRGDRVPRRHHDRPRSHCPGSQESMLGVRHGRLRHWLWHIFRLESRHEPLHYRAHQRVQRWWRRRGGAGRSDGSFRIPFFHFQTLPAGFHVLLTLVAFCSSVAGPVTNGDVEKGSKAQANSNLAEILAVYRQDSHLSVNGGSHEFPGEGTYLFKFDNSYSLWRNKTLYYRVYYSAWHQSPYTLQNYELFLIPVKKKILIWQDKYRHIYFLLSTHVAMFYLRVCDILQHLQRCLVKRHTKKPCIYAMFLCVYECVWCIVNPIRSSAIAFLYVHSDQGAHFFL